MNYKLLEKELKKRTNYPYIWGRKQINNFDNQTNFIYKIYSLNTLLRTIEKNFKENAQYQDLKNYTLNRWFNFWSAKGIETIFCEHKNVTPHLNSYSKYTDFYIKSIPFDHKTTVFPKGFKKSVAYAQQNPKELIEWLYKNQSQQKRKHYKNRLFIVLINTQNNAEHWKLKAEIGWLREIILTYLHTFDNSKLHSFYFEEKTIKATIIWAIK